jgi:hypothetical protein
MFLDELIPVVKELFQQPIAFMGGFVSGVLRLNLQQDPVKSWIDEQAGSTSYTPPTSETSNANSNGPQSISID